MKYWTPTCWVYFDLYGGGTSGPIRDEAEPSTEGRVVFHAETPRGAMVVKAYDQEDGSFYWEETEKGRGTSHSPVASGHMSSEQNLVTALNNHFRSYREFDPRQFKVVVNEIGVRI